VTIVNYVPIGNDDNLWKKILSTLRQTSKEHNDHLPDNLIGNLKTRETNDFLRIWYTLGGGNNIKHVACFSRMKHYETNHNNNVPAWALSVGFRQDLLSNNASDNDYQNFVERFFEIEKGVMGPSSNPEAIGTLGYFVKYVLDRQKVFTVSKNDVATLNGTKKISKLEKKAKGRYPIGAAYWQVKTVLTDYRHPTNFWNNQGSDCSIFEIQLNKADPEGP